MPEAALIFRIVLIIIGVLMCGVDFVSFCKQKLLDRFAFIMAVISVAMIVIGAVPALSGWIDGLTFKSAAVLILCIVFPLWIIYSMCVSISVLTYKNQELAMQVSLLNDESAQYMKLLRKLTEESETVK